MSRIKAFAVFFLVAMAGVLNATGNNSALRAQAQQELQQLNTYMQDAANAACPADKQCYQAYENYVHCELGAAQAGAAPNCAVPNCRPGNCGDGDNSSAPGGADQAQFDQYQQEMQKQFETLLNTDQALAQTAQEQNSGAVSDGQSTDNDSSSQAPAAGEDNQDQGSADSGDGGNLEDNFAPEAQPDKLNQDFPNLDSETNADENSPPATPTVEGDQDGSDGSEAREDAPAPSATATEAADQDDSDDADARSSNPTRAATAGAEEGQDDSDSDDPSYTPTPEARSGDVYAKTSDDAAGLAVGDGSSDVAGEVKNGLNKMSQFQSNAMNGDPEPGPAAATSVGQIPGQVPGAGPGQGPGGGTGNISVTDSAQQINENQLSKYGGPGSVDPDYTPTPEGMYIVMNNSPQGVYYSNGQQPLTATSSNDQMGLYYTNPAPPPASASQSNPPAVSCDIHNSEITVVYTMDSECVGNSNLKIVNHSDENINIYIWNGEEGFGDLGGEIDAGSYTIISYQTSHAIGTEKTVKVMAGGCASAIGDIGNYRPIQASIWTKCGAS